MHGARLSESLFIPSPYSLRRRSDFFQHGSHLERLKLFAPLDCNKKCTCLSLNHTYRFTAIDSTGTLLPRNKLHSTFVTRGTCRPISLSLWHIGPVIGLLLFTLMLTTKMERKTTNISTDGWLECCGTVKKDCLGSSPRLPEEPYQRSQALQSQSCCERG